MPLNEALIRKIGKTVEKYMLATGELRRYAEDDLATIDATTLELTNTYTVIYNGKCMVSPMGSTNQRDLGGSVAVAALTYEIGIPLAAGQPQANDVFVVLKGMDPALVKAQFRILGIMPSTFATHRRLNAELMVPSA